MNASDYKKSQSSPTGPLISTANIPVTGGWQTYTDVTALVTDPGGTHELFFVFLNNPGDSGLFNINRIDLSGKGWPSSKTGVGAHEPYHAPSTWSPRSRSRLRDRLARLYPRKLAF